MADRTPGPVPIDVHTMVPNARMITLSYRHEPVHVLLRRD
jgi:hypothetical protein